MFELGNSLREARMRQGLDFPQVELATKIRTKYIRALEDEVFEILPSETYVKGFLRSYAEYLGLDGQLYVDEYNSRYVVGEDEPVARPRRSTAARRPERHVDSRVVVLTLAGIVAVVALFILAWKFGGSNNGHIANLDNQKPPVTKKHRTHRAVPVSAHLVLRAVGGGCRLEVYRSSATGKLLWAGTLEPGKQALSLWGKKMWVRAGAPRHLSATLNGRRLTFPTGRAVVVTSHGFRRVSAAA
jgi:cytoskeleton protein RodZ